MSSQLINQVVELTNAERAKAGLNPLTLNNQLVQAAQGHSDSMAADDFFSHTGVDGSDVSDRVQDTGYQYSHAGENIAAGQKTAAEVVQGWMDSPGHRANILNAEFTEIGIGYELLENDTGSVNYNHYWTQVFGTPQGNNNQESNNQPNSNESELAPQVPNSTNSDATPVIDKNDNSLTNNTDYNLFDTEVDSLGVTKTQCSNDNLTGDSIIAGDHTVNFFHSGEQFDKNLVDSNTYHDFQDLISFSGNSDFDFSHCELIFSENSSSFDLNQNPQRASENLESLF
jgi:hypothetical protein